MNRADLSFDKFNWTDSRRKYMNRDMTVEVYLCINDNLYWIVVDMQHFTYEMKKITPTNGGSLLLCGDVHTKIPKPHHPANSHNPGSRRRKYYVSYNPDTKGIHFRRIQNFKCGVANLEIDDDEELIAKIPLCIYEISRNTTPEEYLEHKSIFQSLMDEYYSDNMTVYYSYKEKVRDIMVNIIQYYNDHSEEGWKMAVHTVTEFTLAEELDRFSIPCMPAGIPLTPENYLRMVGSR